MDFSLSVDDRQARFVLEGLERRGQSAHGVLEDIGEHMVGSIQQNFREGGRPDRWPARADGKPSYLSESSRLKRGINYRAQARHLQVGPDTLRYALIHQFGGVIKGKPMLAVPVGNVKGRPKDYDLVLIKPKNKKEHWLLFQKGSKGEALRLMFVLRPFVVMPPRPYALWQKEDLEYTEQALAAFMTRGLA